PGQAVLEVGPGLGSLTLGLLEAGGEVVAVELDRGRAELLPLTLRARGVQEARFRLVHADALRVTELPALPGAGAPAPLVAGRPRGAAAGGRTACAVRGAAGAQRRQALRAALAGWAGAAARAAQVLRGAGVAPGARGGPLGIEACRAIAGAERDIA